MLSRAVDACCASVGLVLFSRVAFQLSDKSVWCSQAVRITVIMFTGCVCVSGSTDAECAHCVSSRRTEMLLNMKAVSADHIPLTLRVCAAIMEIPLDHTFY